MLAGATLGEDGALGGIDADADMFAAGKVGTVRIKGSMTNSILGAGFAPVDGKFRDVNDGAIGGAASPLTAFTVKGQMDAQSFVGAGVLPKFVFIGGVQIKAKRDARFISREVMILPEPAVTQLDQTTAVPAAVLRENPHCRRCGASCRDLRRIADRSDYDLCALRRRSVVTIASPKPTKAVTVGSGTVPAMSDSPPDPPAIAEA